MSGHAALNLTLSLGTYINIASKHARTNEGSLGSEKVKAIFVSIAGGIFSVKIPGFYFEFAEGKLE